MEENRSINQYIIDLYYLNKTIRFIFTIITKLRRKS